MRFTLVACVFSLLTVGTSSFPTASADVFDVSKFGASGDGETLDMAAIQAAIDACAENGGGTVYFPGGTYLTGTIFLKDHVRIELDAGACILGSTNLEHYPVIVNKFPSRTDRYCVRSLIWGEGLRDVAITGRGTIDGQGAKFRDNVASDEELESIAKAYEGAGRYRPNGVFVNRPYLIRLVSCRDILVENVHLRNSAMWMQHYLDCDLVTIRGITVFNHGCRNNDMIDIDCCRNVVITDCVGDTDDDALTLKSTGNRPTEQVVISNCILRSHCNAIKAGTESSGGFMDIAITNCVIERSIVPDCLTGRPEGLAGIALEIVDGGSLERVAISNITMEGTSAPIFMRLGNRARPPTQDGPKPPVGTFRNVSISNIVATGGGKTGCAIVGIPGHPIEDVSISNVRIVFDGGGTKEEAEAEMPELEEKYPECTMFGILPSYGFFARHVDGLTFRNVDLDFEGREERPGLVCDDVQDLKLDEFNAREAQKAFATVDYDIQLDTIRAGFDKKMCWVHPRAGTIPGETPIVVLTMQKLLLSGSDVFYALNEMRTDDLGGSWSGPVEHETLGRRQEDEGIVSVICDFTPMWHEKTGTLLGTGHVARYKGNHLAGDYERQTAYSWYDPDARTWAPWRTVDMPDDPKFHSSGAGSTQRVDFPNGDILLPFYFRAKGVKTASSAVMRCRFDGETLKYVEHGDELTIDVPRGMGEPSLAQFGGKFFLTLRNDVKGYVTSGPDGLHFDEPKPWTFDDGEELGSYNTQQHWVTHGDALFLVFTRRDPNHDHVFRHRAPLRIAQVDPEALCVVRSTERILVPEQGARLGNFAVTRVSDRETWVTVAEWMQPVGCEKYGSDNRVYAARIMWKE